MPEKRPLRRVTAQINGAASFIRKPFGQRLKLRVRLRGGRLLMQPSEQFQFEIALNIKNFTYWQDR